MSDTTFVDGVTVVRASWLNDVNDRTYSTVNVKSTAYGAVGDGVADDTAAIQAALNSGATSIFIPQGTYKCGNLLVPNTFGLTIYGEGNGSQLVQNTVSAPLFRWATTSIYYGEHTLRDFSIVGTVGAGHCIDTTGAGGISIYNVYITDVPVGKSGIYVDGAAATYVHDTRLNNIQIYTNTAGHSGIRFGPLSADASIADFIMNGNFVTSYCVYLDVAAQTLAIADSHIYNAGINILKAAGSLGSCTFTGVTFDNATNDLLHLTTTTNSVFTSCYFEAIKSGFSGLNLDTCSGISIYNSHWDGGVGSLSCVKSNAGSTDVFVVGGAVPGIINFTTPFDLLSPNSYARGISGFNPLSLQYGQSFTTQTAQLQATTNYLGVNGLQAAEDNTYYLVPHSSKLLNAYVAVSTTPAAGQTYTFTVLVNGAPVGTPLVVNNGSFGGVITATGSVAQYDRISIQSVFSATSGSSLFRGLINLSA